MNSEEFNLARIDALEKRVKELEEIIHQYEKNKDKAKGYMGCDSPQPVCK